MRLRVWCVLSSILLRCDAGHTAEVVIERRWFAETKLIRYLLDGEVRMRVHELFGSVNHELLNPLCWRYSRHRTEDL